MMANHREKEWIWQGKKYKCKPGQFITSLSSIAKKSGTSIQNVRTALKNFEKIYEFLTSKSTNRNRLITIVNWEYYQSQDNELTNSLTSSQQAANKQLTTNKNVKNVKNDKEVYRQVQHMKLTVEDFNKLRKLYSKNEIDNILDQMENWKKLKNYTDPYRTANNWLKRAHPNRKEREVLG